MQAGPGPWTGIKHAVSSGERKGAASLIVDERRGEEERERRAVMQIDGQQILLPSPSSPARSVRWMRMRQDPPAASLPRWRTAHLPKMRECGLSASSFNNLTLSIAYPARI